MRLKHSCIFILEKKNVIHQEFQDFCAFQVHQHFLMKALTIKVTHHSKESGIDKFNLGLCLYPQVQTDGSASDKLKSKQVASTVFWLYTTSYIDDYHLFPRNEKTVLEGSRSY